MNLFGLDVNLIWFILIFFTLVMLFLGGSINMFGRYIPKILRDAFFYGKTAEGSTDYAVVRAIEVPKSYFLHFYVFACMYMPILLWLCSCVYLLEVPIPNQVINLLSFIGTRKRIANASSEGTFIAMVLLTIQCFRRLYECAFINAKSKSKMNILHYIVGFAHYFCAGTGILLEAPGFVPNISMDGISEIQWIHVSVHINNVSWMQYLGIVIFCFAWYLQYSAHLAFARMKRLNPGGHSAPPSEGMFRYVSCPHYFAEILIYFSLSLILGMSHQTGIVIFLWVLINQIVAAQMSHQWYKKTFADYPKNRKAVIPFVL